MQNQPSFRHQLNAAQIAYILNTDKHLLKQMSQICFRRCIVSFEREHLNAAE